MRAHCIISRGIDGLLTHRHDSTKYTATGKTGTLPMIGAGVFLPDKDMR